jgi:hypothetical protein
MPQRSPVIFWLLVAATIAVDAVVLAWVLSNRSSDVLYAIAAFHSLCVSQLSVVCIWSAVVSRKTVWTRIAPLLATLIASISTAVFINAPIPLDVAITSYLAQYGLQAVLILVVLWLLQRTAFWRRISGEPAKWRYSVAQLLVAMTVVAVLAAAMRRSTFLDHDFVNVAYTCCYAALAVASVFFWTLSQPSVVRLSGVLGVAIWFAAALSLVETPPTRIFSIFMVAHFVIQAIVLSVWLGLGPILPLPRDVSAAS